MQDYLKAGQIISQAISYGKEIIKPGKNILEACKQIEQKIRDLGGEIAFPAQVSINQVAAHWCPDPDDTKVFTEQDLVKLDIGCHINGYIADTAVSIDLTKENKYKKLILTAEKARDEAIKAIKPGVKVAQIGKIIQETITKEGFSPIRNLSGHGLKQYQVHTPPSIPNVETNDQTILEEGMVIAVEPFVTNGQGIVYEQEYGNIYSLNQVRPIRHPYARKALKIIQQYKGLPFSLHEIADKMSVAAAKLALKELARENIITVYPPLIEAGDGVVAQAEHSVIVQEQPIVYTKSQS